LVSAKLPAFPRPSDEVAENDLYPVDPKLRERAWKISPPRASRTIAAHRERHRGLPTSTFCQTPGGAAPSRTWSAPASGLRLPVSISPRVLSEEGVPQDLNLPGPGESASKPLAPFRGPGPAALEFVQWRGNEYGLKRNWWVDERLTPKRPRAPRPSISRPLRPVWRLVLAIAAYNCGPGNVQKGRGAPGLRRFLGALQANVLPRETKNYVPIILASP